MTAVPRFIVSLQRIEVHLLQDPDALEDESIWSISVWPEVEGEVVIWGYLRRKSGRGYGQAQSVGVVREHPLMGSRDKPEDVADFREWVEQYAAEALYDVARRSLQAQAALMDFQFELDVMSPSTEIEFQILEDESDDDSSEAAPNADSVRS